MKLNKYVFMLLGLAALVATIGAGSAAAAEERGFFVKNKEQSARAATSKPLTCKGEVQLVRDAANENVLTTTAIFGTTPGGGEGGEFDSTPVLTIKGVTLDEGECLNAHFSAIVGSARTYGVAPLALFQVTVTPEGGAPLAMVGHYDTPYGIAAPAVAIEAEQDVDMIGSNFFQAVGDGKHEVRPGNYRVDVWWAGAPPGVPGGAIGAAFVLKLYLRD